MSYHPAVTLAEATMTDLSGRAGTSSKQSHIASSITTVQMMLLAWCALGPVQSRLPACFQPGRVTMSNPVSLLQLHLFHAADKF